MGHAARDVDFACRCGLVKGALTQITPSAGTHARCHCNDCRGAVMHFGEPDPRPNGVSYFQTTPDRVRFDSGAENLAVLSLRAGSLLRWYATCCGAPLFNTMGAPKFPFASLYVARARDTAPLGPVIADGFIDKGDGKQAHKGLAKMIWRMVRRTLAARLTGRWKHTPFFDVHTLKPVVRPTVLTPQDRAALDLPEAAARRI